MSAGSSRRTLLVKRAGLAVGALAVLLVVVYFVATSAWCLKRLVLPRVSRAIGATITVEDARLSPFSAVTLTSLKVQTTGAEPLVTAKQVVARYGLLRILGGHYQVEELTVSDPVVRVVVNADGTSNLDPFTRKPAAAPSPPRPGPAPQVDVKQFALRNAAFSFTRHEKDGRRTVAELSQLNFTVKDLKNGQTASFNLGAGMRFRSGAATNLDELIATLQGALQIGLSPDLAPQKISGGLEMAVSQATGAFAEVGRLNASLKADLAPGDIKELALHFTKAGQPLGTISARGPFDLLNREGRLQLAVSGVGAEVLSLVGGRFGMQFGAPKLAANLDLELKKKGRFVNAQGRITGEKFAFARGGQPAPALDFQAGGNLTLDLDATNAVVRALTLHATQNGRPLLQATLSKEMALDWSRGSQAVAESSLELALTDVNLAEWRAFVGTNVTSGVFNARLGITVQKAGRAIAFDLDSKLTGLAAQFGTNRLDRVGLDVAARGQAADFNQITLPTLSLNVTHSGQPMASVKGTGQFTVETRDADFQAELNAPLAQVTAWLGRPDVSISSGALHVTTRLTQKNTTPAPKQAPVREQSVTGQLRLADFTGRLGTNRFDRFELGVEFEAAVKNHLAEIRKCAGTLQQAGQAGGRFSVGGRYHLADQTGEITVQLADLNQVVLRSFLESALGGQTLRSLSLNGDLAARLDPQSGSSARGRLSVTNLLVSGPAETPPKAPLSAEVNFDAGLGQQRLDLRQFKVALAPTDRARNQAELTGQLDLTKSNAWSGNLKLRAESVDLTACHELLAGNRGTNAAPPQPGSTPAPSEVEPPALALPFEQFTFDVQVGRLYLDEMDVSNFVSRTRISGGKVELNPFQLSLNGAPVNARALLNLGVPGYEYDVTLRADQVPLAPLVNSFQPERKGQIGGTATLNAQIQGAGVTGAGLQKNLRGQFDLVATNLSLSIANVKGGVLKSVVNVVVGIPDLIRNPAGAVVGLVGKLTGASPAEKAGWLDQLTHSPINHVLARAQAGNGRIDVEQGFAESAAFQASATGTVTLAPVLTNSTLHLPVKIWLRRPLAEKVGLVPADAPADATFVKLPDFVTVQGTVGKHEVKTDGMVLAAMVGKAGLGILGNTGKAATSTVGSVLGTLGGVLGLGGGAAPPAGANSNAAPAAPPSSTPGPAPTNAPAPARPRFRLF